MNQTKNEQPTRYTTCCQCHGILDKQGDITNVKIDGERRYFHPLCYARIRDEYYTPEFLAKAGLL